MAKELNKDTWAGAVKALGLRSLSFGKFWQLCATAICLVFLWRCRAEDMPQLLTIVLTSPWFIILGWMGFALSVVVSVVITRLARRQYLAEIERLVDERSNLQNRLLNNNLSHSGYEPNK